MMVQYRDPIQDEIKEKELEMEKQKKKYKSDLTTMKKTVEREERKRCSIESTLRKRQNKWSDEKTKLKETVNNNNNNNNNDENITLLENLKKI